MLFMVIYTRVILKVSLRGLFKSRIYLDITHHTLCSEMDILFSHAVAMTGFFFLFSAHLFWCLGHRTTVSSHFQHPYHSEICSHQDVPWDLGRGESLLASDLYCIVNGINSPTENAARVPRLKQLCVDEHYREWATYLLSAAKDCIV